VVLEDDKTLESYIDTKDAAYTNLGIVDLLMTCKTDKWVDFKMFNSATVFRTDRVELNDTVGKMRTRISKDGTFDWPSLEEYEIFYND